MSSVVIVGAQWGDEGKGKIVDLYTEDADMVVRYAGGPNAGHTLVVGQEKVVVRLLPSGILRPTTSCIIGQGMVIDLGVLAAEIDELTRRGYRGVEERLAISDRAHLILPYHILVDRLREGAASAETAIGTTKKGIGPAYEDKVRRTGLRLGELRHPDKLERRAQAALEAWAPIIQALGGQVPSVEEVLAPVLALAPRFLPLLANTSARVDAAVSADQRVLFEGAQGTLLDIDHGTYPFVTSSSASAGGAAIGAGIGPNRLDTVVGITKAYTTRVGGGPFPTELDDEQGERLRQLGGEFGAVTGRPRRTGWLDLPALRYAARVNGLDGLALTKLDVLSGFGPIKTCVAYDTPEGRVEDLPIDALDTPGQVTPVYVEHEGWTETLEHCRTLDELPIAARRYIRFIEEQTRVPVYLVSVGQERRATIVLQHPFLGRAAAP